jgi:hypothetical protein
MILVITRCIENILGRRRAAFLVAAFGEQECTVEEHSKTVKSDKRSLEIVRIAGTKKIRPESITNFRADRTSRNASFISNHHASLGYFPTEKPPLILSNLFPMTPAPGNTDRKGRCVQTQKQRQAELDVVSDELSRRKIFQVVTAIKASKSDAKRTRLAGKNKATDEFRVRRWPSL